MGPRAQPMAKTGVQEGLQPRKGPSVAVARGLYRVLTAWDRYGTLLVEPGRHPGPGCHPSQALGLPLSARPLSASLG